MDYSNDIHLTRYLYVKDEVIIAFMLSIIQHDNSAYFWSSELYYSGYRYELIRVIWNIYYDFYYSYNPSFENYLLNKLKNIGNDKDDMIIIGNIIENFKIRKHNMDVFILLEISKQFDFEIDFMSDYMNQKDYNLFKIHFIGLLNSNDYLMIGFLVVKVIYEEHFSNLLETISEIFSLEREKIMEGFVKICKKNTEVVNPRKLLLSRVIQIITEQKNRLKKNKNIYITIDDDNIIKYTNVTSSMCKNINDRTLPPYKVLSKVQLNKIDESKCLSLFCLKRENIDKYELFEHWLYFASFSPLWKKRIEKYNGEIFHENKKVVFHDEDLEEDFFNKYDMELDEQSREIQDSIMCSILKKKNFRDLYLQHNKNSIINIDNDILDEIDKIKYWF